MPTYYLISNANDNPSGNLIHEISSSKKALHDLATKLWTGPDRDKWDAILYKNHQVLSKTAAIKLYGRKAFDSMLDLYTNGIPF